MLTKGEGGKNPVNVVYEWPLTLYASGYGARFHNTLNLNINKRMSLGKVLKHSIKMIIRDPKTFHDLQNSKGTFINHVDS